MLKILDLLAKIASLLDSPQDLVSEEHCGHSNCQAAPDTSGGHGDRLVSEGCIAFGWHFGAVLVLADCRACMVLGWQGLKEEVTNIIIVFAHANLA